MSPNPRDWRGWRKPLLVIIFLCIPLLGLAKSKAKKGGDFDLTGIIHPDLINSQSDPTLRFPVMNTGGSIFSITYGWLDISNNTVSYTVVQPTRKSDHTFQVSRFPGLPSPTSSATGNG
jgi:hypothetical protein